MINSNPDKDGIIRQVCGDWDKQPFNLFFLAKGSKELKTDTVNSRAAGTSSLITEATLGGKAKHCSVLVSILFYFLEKYKDLEIVLYKFN